MKRLYKTPKLYQFPNMGKLSSKQLSLLSDKEFYEQACKDCEQVFKDQQGALNVVIDRLKRIL